ncbi:copper amine oxidase N-terminal domain-containing protein [Paenibacillaceae bacterium]|nr:copper amine oxidase N-terminal domain-containing protein [Paenibacillaceae bacterium]
MSLPEAPARASKKRRPLNMRKKMKSGIIISAAALLLAALFGYTEFFYGPIKKWNYKRDVLQYLHSKYDEPMKVTKVVYYWDSALPISAVAYPADKPDLSFTVMPDKSSPSGYRDGYAPELWKFQASADLQPILSDIDEEYLTQTELAFACCQVSEYDYDAIQGTVPDYRDTELPFELTIRINRAMKATDITTMHHYLSALQTKEKPELEQIMFVFSPNHSSAQIQYRFPGTSLGDIEQTDLEKFNESRLPAKDIATITGASVQWDGENEQAVFTLNNTVLKVNSWGYEALLNGEIIESPLDAYIGGENELLVPVRLIEQAFDTSISLEDV